MQRTRRRASRVDWSCSVARTSNGRTTRVGRPRRGSRPCSRHRSTALVLLDRRHDRVDTTPATLAEASLLILLLSGSSLAIPVSTWTGAVVGRDQEDRLDPGLPTLIKSFTLDAGQEKTRKTWPGCAGGGRRGTALGGDEHDRKDGRRTRTRHGDDARPVQAAAVLRGRGLASTSRRQGGQM